MGRPWERATRSAWTPALLGGAAGVLLALGAPPFSYVLAPFAAVAVLERALAVAVQARSPWRHATALGLALGTTAHAIALCSLVTMFERFGRLSPAAAWALSLLTWAAQALPYVATALVSTAVIRRGGPGWLVVPPALSACAALVPQLFPWQPGALLVDWLAYAQLADVGGAGLLTVCMALCACATLESVRARGRDRFAMGIAALTIAAPLAYASARLPHIERAREHAARLRIGAVQPNPDVEERRQRTDDAGMLAHLRKASAALEARGAELVVWSESAYPYRLSHARTMQPLDARRVVDGTLHGPVLMGAISYELDVHGEREHNSAWLVREDGSLAGYVDKAKLVPFAEFVPFWSLFPPLRAWFATPGLVPGHSGTLALADHQLGVLICYEDLFPDLARDVAKRGANMLVNLTNDGWFGASAEPLLHDTLARMRAIEVRRDFVRVTSTGVSSFSDATGRLRARTDGFVEALLLADTRLLELESPFARLGDWVTPLCIAWLAIAWLVASRARPQTS